MGAKLTVGQILLIAEKLEENGAGFYTKMASHVFSDSHRRELCLKLGEWRAERKLKLEQRCKQYYEQEAKLWPVDSDDYLQTHPTILADLAVFDEYHFPPSSLSGQESPKEIIKDAIAKAREAITFYQGLKDFARDDKARAVLDQMADEERHFINILEISPDFILGGRRTSR